MRGHPKRAARRVNIDSVSQRTAAYSDYGVRSMRLQGQRSNTGAKLLLLLVVVIVIAAVYYFLYMAPR
jgi:hypothetical protein